MAEHGKAVAGRQHRRDSLQASPFGLHLYTHEAGNTVNRRAVMRIERKISSTWLSPPTRTKAGTYADWLCLSTKTLHTTKVVTTIHLLRICRAGAIRGV